MNKAVRTGNAINDPDDIGLYTHYQYILIFPKTFPTHLCWISLNLKMNTMKPYVANLIYGILLVLLSLWGYMSSETPSVTAFIPTAFGVVLLALTPAMKKGNKAVAHIVVILTLLVLGGLVKPLLGAMGRTDNMAMARVIVMMAWGVVAMVVYIKSFIDARRNRVEK